MTSSIIVRNVSLRYGKSFVLENISFPVEQGSFLVIIGPNGAGKTSLIKLLAGIEKSPTGSITVLDRLISQYSRKQLARHLALVGQQVPTGFPFSVAQTVLMGRSPYLDLLGFEKKRDFELASQAMEFVDVLHLADRRLDQLSGGERQRVMIARAICQQPQIILLDEPTTALDPAHQLRIMDLMERFRQEQGTTVIMISHDLNLAAMYGDQLLLLKKGKILASGKPSEVLQSAILQQGYGCRFEILPSTHGNFSRISPVPEKNI